MILHPWASLCSVSLCALRLVLWLQHHRLNSAFSLAFQGNRCPPSSPIPPFTLPLTESPISCNYCFWGSTSCKTKHATNTSKLNKSLEILFFTYLIWGKLRYMAEAMTSTRLPCHSQWQCQAAFSDMWSGVASYTRIKFEGTCSQNCPWKSLRKAPCWRPTCHLFTCPTSPETDGSFLWLGTRWSSWCTLRCQRTQNHASLTPVTSTWGVGRDFQDGGCGRGTSWASADSWGRFLVCVSVCAWKRLCLLELNSGALNVPMVQLCTFNSYEKNVLSHCLEFIKRKKEVWGKKLTGWYTYFQFHKLGE